MKKSIFFCLLASFAFANECDDKIAKLKNELEFAKKHNNAFKIQGLNVAINELSSKCKDDPAFYAKALETKAQKQKALAELETKLSELESQKKMMSKAEFKAKKLNLKHKKIGSKPNLKHLNFIEI